MSLTVNLKHQLPDLTLDIAFDVPNGITGLFGKSGAGKTTIINAIAGLIQSDQNYISVNGQVLSDSKSGINLAVHKRRVGYIFQEARLFPHFNVRKNLEYGARFSSESAPVDLFDQVVEMLGIETLLTRRPMTLSGGEQQRVAIGRALLSQPRLILADEPLAALDEGRKREILPYFERLRDEMGVSIVYVSHSAMEVARLATQVVVVDKGHVIAQGLPTEILGDLRIQPMGLRGVGSVLEARIVRHDADGLSELMVDDFTLTLPAMDKAAGARIRLFIKAQDVMLSLKNPTDISALNVIAARIEDIRPGDGPGAMVKLRAGKNVILSRITKRSAEALKLETGQKVYAVIKAVSVAPEAVGG